MYSFEGDFRQRPSQSLGGASKKQHRDDVLQRAFVERQKREDLRRQLNSAIQIQTFIRGTLVRIRQERIERQLFDVLKAEVQADAFNATEANLSLLLRKLIFFYKEKEDGARLVWLAQVFLKVVDKCVIWLASNKDLWLFKLMKLQELCLGHLVSCARNKQPIAVPLRILETFLSVDTYSEQFSPDNAKHLVCRTMLFMARRAYFQNVRILVDELVPSSMEHTITALTPIAETLLHLLLKPLLLISSYANEADKIQILCEFTLAFLSPSFSKQVSEFILPTLAQKGSRFPFVSLVESLLYRRNSDTNHKGASYVELRVEPTPFLLYSVIVLASNHTGDLSGMAIWSYLQLLKLLVPTLNRHQPTTSLEVSSDSEDEMLMDTNEQHLSDGIQPAFDSVVELINEPRHVQLLLSVTEQEAGHSHFMALCHLCDSLLTHHKLAIYKYRLLHTLAFKPNFLRYLWYTLTSLSTSSIFGSPVPLVQLLSRGLPLTLHDRSSLVPVLSLFCSLFGYLLQTLHDSEFYGEGNGADIKHSSVMPFDLEELAAMGLTLRDVCLGLIDLAYPNNRANVMDNYVEAMLSIGKTSSMDSVAVEEHLVHLWSHLFKVTANLLRQLYSRDTRRSFCPPDHWIAKHMVIPVYSVMKRKSVFHLVIQTTNFLNNTQPSDLQLRHRGRQNRLQFGTIQNLSREQLEEGPPMSTTKLKNITILQELPFVVPFFDRVMVFQQLVIKDKAENQGEFNNFLSGPQIQVMIRRTHIYEDAFDKLSPENESNLKLKMRVQLVNYVGLDEAGIDGGGICREFINELLLTSFNPNRGFFILTHGNLLYPNPNVHLIVDNFPKHYYFIGRILGKAIYENMLVELPFASFFLSKLLGRLSANVDIDHLNSLDPVLYRNLLSLKEYDGDVSDLGLDFTVVVDEMGETKIEELVPGGAKIPITETNKIRYIHLMADYKLNKQIHAQCMAFKQGLFNVLDPKWLQIFDWKELQVLISGALVPVDIDDLRQNTNYAGSYTAEHPVIQLFWKVVSDFDDKQKRKLLKFVTSCSRPPLLGFKDLYPVFCIQNSGSDDRLPSSSTCMNLLKLPEFRDEKTLRSKLLYAVESGSGFELS